MLRAAFRLTRLALHMLGGFAVSLALPLLSPRLRQSVLRWWARGLLAALGIRLHVSGLVRFEPGLVVANHISWLDVAAILAVRPAIFVCKSEVAGWPGIGWLLRRTETIFIRRASFRDAWRVVLALRGRLMTAQTAAVFPEGTTTDGHDLLPFKPALFQSAIDADMPVYPMAIAYSSGAAAFIGETTFVQSLWMIACARNLQVHVAQPAPISTQGMKRRELAARASSLIRARLVGLQLFAGETTLTTSVRRPVKAIPTGT